MLHGCCPECAEAFRSVVCSRREAMAWRRNIWAVPLESADLVVESIFTATPVEPPARTDFADGTYLHFAANGVELCFDRTPDGRTSLGAVHVRPPVPGAPPLLRPLPYGLSLHLTGRTVVELLGEPSRKGGGGRHGGAAPLFILYEARGLQLTFSGRDWNNAGVAVAEICLCKPSSVAATEVPQAAASAVAAPVVVGEEAPVTAPVVAGVVTAPAAGDAAPAVAASIAALAAAAKGGGE